MKGNTTKYGWTTASTKVICRSSDGTVVQARPLRLDKHAVTIEVAAPDCPLRTSELLQDLQIVLQDQVVYSGQGTVRSLVDAGTNVACEVTLEPAGWKLFEQPGSPVKDGWFGERFKEFLNEWQKLYKVSPQYKAVVADMNTFLTDLRLWVEQLELALGPGAGRASQKDQELIAEKLAKPVLPCIDALFEKFEAVAAKVEPDLAPVHYTYARRQLHPVVLCAPLLHRAFVKPLGYAGDYKTVEMIALNRYEGASLFAKLINAWFLRQPPAAGHRNRLLRFKKQLAEETARALSAKKQKVSILNVGCGPAWEVQQFVAQDPLSSYAEFTLLDFNPETIRYVMDILGEIKTQHRRRTKFNVIQLSVQQLLRQERLSNSELDVPKFDFIYCGGLFDYLSDGVCMRLIELLYKWLGPDGLLVVTNLDPSNPSRGTMEHIADWHLMYRSARDLLALKPEKLRCAETRVYADSTGTNLFLELRKPHDA
ncbi:MAG: class I SAM-dependent methyltransferase [Verrucomicrobiae bacterium]|nr:class I SAM-dependent methyltransferase [Verrucomicrobiae bacterium]MCX7722172.1 class I SAM-dependent methyltransferase [Verrucomicrobiae bacterium]MDW7980788.1 class I SAM-dependent methyltransferase [Verrucomicrobiales bacterium]